MRRWSLSWKLSFRASNSGFGSILLPRSIGSQRFRFPVTDCKSGRYRNRLGSDSNSIMASDAEQEIALGRHCGDCGVDKKGGNCCSLWWIGKTDVSTCTGDEGDHSRRFGSAGAISTILILFAICRVGLHGTMEVVGATGKLHEIDIWMVAPISRDLLAYLICNPIGNYFNMVDRPVHVATAAGSWTNMIGEVGCALVETLLQVFYHVLCLNNRFLASVLM